MYVSAQRGPRRHGRRSRLRDARLHPPLIRNIRRRDPRGYAPNQRGPRQTLITTVGTWRATMSLT